MNAKYHHALATGTRIDAYEISNVLGVGGFGVTYQAYDHTLQRQVAMKEYLPTGLAIRTPNRTTVSPKSENDVENYEYGLKRFLEEARTLAKFREPHIVRVIRYLEAHGTAYFIMDYEEGEALSGRLKKRLTLKEDEIRAIVIPILRSLRAVHEQKFLHRDIKPANIYLRRNDGSPVLLDFGSARQALGEQSHAMTGLVTPGYAPFEQYFSRGKQGPATDLYGIGATIYHCMTGFAPVASTERIAAMQDGEPDPIEIGEHANKKYSEPFLRAVLWMLEPNAKHRPQNVEQALAALEEEAQKTTNEVSTTISLSQEIEGVDKTEFPETNTIDQLQDTGISWEADVLQTVEVNLERHIGPLSKALVRKAAQKTSNVEELTELLARFIPSERDKTQFLAKTQVISNTEMVKQFGDVAEPLPATPAETAPAAAIEERILKTAEENLATYLGPVAKILVKKAARRTSDLDEFCRILAKELPDEAQQSAFRTALMRKASS